MLFIGLDLGTSGLKGTMLDEKGTVIDKITIAYSLSMPQIGYSEQDPLTWLNAAKEAIKKLSKGREKDITGLSIAGQMHGLVLLDQNDQVIRPCILWNDGRSVEETDYLNTTIGEDVLLNHTGNIAFAGFTLPKLLWVKAHEPENYARIAKIMLPKDFIAYQLTGIFASDYSDLSGTLFFDCEHKRYSERMLEIAGITEEVLPTPFPSTASIGLLKPEFGLPHCLMTIGGGDNACAAIGTGVLEDGEAMISLGTSGTIFLPTSTFLLPKESCIHSFDDANNNYHLMGCILSASSCNKWWLGKVLCEDDFSEFAIPLEKLGHNDVFFAPYLMGERSPYNDVKVRGAFVNLSLSTTKEEMSQAILEGIGFAFNDCLMAARKLGLPVEAVRVSGGGSRNVAMLHILADVLNVSVVTLKTEEGPSFGAAILAMVGAGLYQDLATATKAIVKINETILPDPERVTLYSKKYETFHKIYPLLKQLEK